MKNQGKNKQKRTKNRMEKIHAQKGRLTVPLRPRATQIWEVKKKSIKNLASSALQFLSHSLYIPAPPCLSQLSFTYSNSSYSIVSYWIHPFHYRSLKVLAILPGALSLPTFQLPNQPQLTVYLSWFTIFNSLKGFFKSAHSSSVVVINPVKRKKI